VFSKYGGGTRRVQPRASATVCRDALQGAGRRRRAGLAAHGAEMHGAEAGAGLREDVKEGRIKDPKEIRQVVSRPLLAHCFSLCDLRLFVNKRMLLSSLESLSNATLPRGYRQRTIAQNIRCNRMAQYRPRV